MAKPSHFVRMNVMFDSDQEAMLTEIAEAAGITRAAIVNYLLHDQLLKLATIPQRSRLKCVRDVRMLLKGQDDFIQNVVRHAKGASLAYVEAQVDSLLTLHGERYDSLR